MVPIVGYIWIEKKNRKINWSVRIYANPSVSLFVVVTDVSFQFSRETIYLRVTCLSLFEYCSKWFYDRWQDGINWWPALHYLLDSFIQQQFLKELTNKLGNSQTNDVIWFDFFFLYSSYSCNVNQIVSFFI